MWYSLIEQIS